MLDQVRALPTTEPVRLASVVASVAVVAVMLAAVGRDNVIEALAIVVPFVVGGEAARRKVSPAPPNLDGDSDPRLPDPPT